MDFVIHAPPYRVRSGGIRAMYLLSDELRRRGHRAVIAHYDGPQLPDAVHIVPEDHPDQGERTVRWLLGTARKGSEAFAVTWHTELFPDADELRVDLLSDPKHFWRWPGTRSLVLAYGGKTTPPRVDADVLITRFPPWPPTRALLGRALRQGSVLHNNDPMTFLTIEAVLCGCPVILPPDALKLWDEVPGVVRSASDLDRGRETVGGAWEWYEGQKQRHAASVDRFADKCEALWGLDPLRGHQEAHLPA